MLLLHYDLPFVEHGPIPPHERTWRHPSELAADERAALSAQPVSHSTRVFALTTGTVGLVAIALLVLTVTPSRSSSPVAVSASTTLVSAADLAPAGPTIAGVRRSANADDPVRSGTTVHALATPIGPGDYAVVSRASLDGAEVAMTVDVVLPSGRLAAGQVVQAADDAVLVALDQAEPGHEVAGHRPRDREVVTVMATPPITVAYADIGGLEVAEGTAIIDDQGALVGLCSGDDDGDGTKVVEIDPGMAAVERPGRLDEPATDEETAVETVDEQIIDDSNERSDDRASVGADGQPDDD